jgi:anaerobic selenocysteine-containing dehydrogenase
MTQVSTVESGETSGRSASDLPTACVLCSQNCGLRVDVAKDRIVAVRADERNPITRGYVCNKGFSIGHYVHHAQRVTQPLKRRPDGSFAAVSWEQAIGEIGAKIRELRHAYAPRAIALVGGGGQGNHLDVPYALPFLAGLGSPMWFSALAQEKTQHALVDRWMFRAPLHGYLHGDTDRSQYVLMLGTNPVVSNRGYRARDFIRAIKRDPTRTLVVVDPRVTETARDADRHLAIRPGTDCYFLLAMAAEIVARGLHKQEWLNEHTRGLPDLLPILRCVDRDEMARRCGLAPSEITEVATGFARATSASLFFDLGIEQAPFSTLNSYLTRLIAALTGNIGNSGGAVFHGTFSPATPRLSGTPARAIVSGIPAIEMLLPFGMFSPNLLPEEILQDHPDRIRAVIVEAANPFLQYADTQRYREAFARLDLLVVIDPAMSETARAAHYVLPAPVGYEKWEYSAFPKRFPEIDMQVRPPVVSGPEQALPESEIYARLAKAVGIVENAPKVLHTLARRTRSSAGAALYLATLSLLATAKGDLRSRSIARLVFWLYETIGPQLPASSLSAIWALCQLFALTRREAIVRTFPAAPRNPFACGNMLFEQILEHPEGVELAQLHVAGNLRDFCGYLDKRIRLAPRPMLTEMRRALQPPAQSPKEFPLILNGGLRTRWNANTIQRDPAWQKGSAIHHALRLNPTDAAQLGVHSGDQVEIATPRGQARTEAVVDDTVRIGHVLIPNGSGIEYPDPITGTLRRAGININELTDSAARDPFTGCPYHKTIPCRITRVRK